ncbi:hypothetical protein MHYP_G00265770 [Metynnis hypsauchen]
MQRALGMDMDTPRSKSQQQIHSPSQPSKPQPQTAPQTPTLAPAQPQPPPPSQTSQIQPKPQPQPAQDLQKQLGPDPSKTAPQSKLPAPGAIPLPGLAKAPSQPDLSRSGPGVQPQTRSAGSSPSRQPPPPEQPFGKLFGFGASLLNQASSLISVEPTQAPAQAPAQAQPSPAKTPQKQPGGPPVAPKPGPQATPTQQQKSRPKVTCPLCKTELNVGVPTEPPNYNHCTQCHAQVCNMCGFNPTPHLTELCTRVNGCAT